MKSEDAEIQQNGKAGAAGPHSYLAGLIEGAVHDRQQRLQRRKIPAASAPPRRTRRPSRGRHTVTRPDQEPQAASRAPCGMAQRAEATWPGIRPGQPGARAWCTISGRKSAGSLSCRMRYLAWSSLFRIWCVCGPHHTHSRSPQPAPGADAAPLACAMLLQARLASADGCAASVAPGCPPDVSSRG